MKPAPQELWCERCNEPTPADDWIDGLHALICPACLAASLDIETALAARQLEQQP
jgi:hypothetical protein